MPTRNIAKSGEVLNWGGFSPFQLQLGLIVNRSQSASCHIANRCWQLKKTTYTTKNQQHKLVFRENLVNNERKTSIIGQIDKEPIISS